MNDIIRLRDVECRDCYKCIRNCPVKAIRYSDGRAEIVTHECILCGECVVTCPQRGDFVFSQVDEIRKLIAEGRRVVASIAPSFVSDLPVGSIEGMRATLQAMGFYDAEETAIGAEIVAREYERLMREDDMSLLISSCCTSVVMLIKRYYPQVLPFLAPVKSPMEIHCAMLKQKYPDACTVFVGPCYAKKGEALHSDAVDYVLTFYELHEWMRSAGIEPVNIPIKPGDGPPLSAPGWAGEIHVARGGLEPCGDRWRERLHCGAERDQARRRPQDVYRNDGVRGQLRQWPRHSQESL